MRRLSLAALLTLLLGLLVVLAPTSLGSTTTTRIVPVDADEVSVSLERTRTVALDDPAQHVALYWQGNPHAHVTVAFSRDGETYGAPVDAGRDGAAAPSEHSEPGKDDEHGKDGGHDEHGSGTTYGAVLDADDAVSLRVSSDRPIARLTVLAMRDGQARYTTRSAATASAVAASTQPPVRSRGQWGADERLRSGSPSFAKVRKLIVHHTAGSNTYTNRAEAESQLRAILRYHTVTRGWSDIGYNFLVDKFGNVYEGRWSRSYPAGVSPTGDNASGYGVVGAHASGWNTGTMGVALLGTHTSAGITPAARASLESLLAWGASRNGINPMGSDRFTSPTGRITTNPNIAGHRDYGSTECPGGALYATLPALRVAVAARTAGSPAPSDPAPAPKDTTPPTRPTGLTAAPLRHRVTLTWTRSTDNSGVAPRYRVLRSRSATGTFTRIATVGSPTYVNTGLRRKRVFFYKVRAVDAAGNLSAFSNTVRTRTR
jgi:hypothetical protein